MAERPVIEIPPNAHPNADEPETKRPVFPQGVFRIHNEPFADSKNIGGFNNAKAASMLERGLRKKEIIHYLGKGNSGVFIPYDGQEVEVTVQQGIHMKNGKSVFTFKDTSGNLFDVSYEDKWDFYTRTKAVPFVPRPRRKTRRARKQRGGFYPSVYGGVAGATMLTPLVARQMMRMYETNARKTRKSKSKKTLKNKRA
jgi:hypothetical protein